MNVSFHFSGIKIPRSAIPWLYSYYKYIVFKELAKLFSRVAVPFYILTSNVWSDPVSLHPRQHLVLSLFFILVILFKKQFHLFFEGLVEFIYSSSCLGVDLLEVEWARIIRIWFLALGFLNYKCY